MQCLLLRFTPDGKHLVVAQLSLSRLLLVAAPPVGGIGHCSVKSSIQLADQVLPHLMDVSAETGAIYVAEIGAKQVQKYVPLESFSLRPTDTVSSPGDLSRESSGSHSLFRA